MLLLSGPNHGGRSLAHRFGSIFNRSRPLSEVFLDKAIRLEERGNQEEADRHLAIAIKEEYEEVWNVILEEHEEAMADIPF